MARHETPEVRRAQILLAAIDVCGRKGYHAARIDDIAATAGLSKGAIYHHFDSKMAIYSAVLEHMLDEATSTISRLDAQGMPVADVLRAMIEEQLAHAEGRPELTRGLIELFLVCFREPEFRRRFDRHYAAFLAAGERLIRHGMERRELRRDIDPAAAARALLMGGDGLVFLHVILDQQSTGIESATLLMELVLDGLAAPE